MTHAMVQQSNNVTLVIEENWKAWLTAPTTPQQQVISNSPILIKYTQKSSAISKFCTSKIVYKYCTLYLVPNYSY